VYRMIEWLQENVLDKLEEYRFIVPLQSLSIIIMMIIIEFVFHESVKESVIECSMRWWEGKLLLIIDESW